MLAKKILCKCPFLIVYNQFHCRKDHHIMLQAKRTKSFSITHTVAVCATKLNKCDWGAPTFVDDQRQQERGCYLKPSGNHVVVRAVDGWFDRARAQPSSSIITSPKIFKHHLKIHCIKKLLVKIHSLVVSVKLRALTINACCTWNDTVHAHARKTAIQKLQ